MDYNELREKLEKLDECQMLSLIFELYDKINTLEMRIEDIERAQADAK